MKITFFGDICPTDDYRKAFDDLSGKSLFNNVLEFIEDSDFTICNFECPATEEKTAIKKCGPSLKAKKQDLTLLKNIGITAVSLANNHTLDYGVQGFLDTTLACEENGVQYFGAQIKGDKGKNKLVLKKGGEIVTIFSFAEEEFNYSVKEKTGAIKFDPYYSLDEISEAKKNGKVVVLYHGGIEYYRYPSPLLRKKCLRMAEKGADLILCQHSHIIGTKELKDDSFILYGQGNSVFGYREDSQTWNQGLVVVFDTQQGVSLKLIRADEHGVKKADEKASAEILSNIESESQKINPQFVEEKWQEFCETKSALYYPMLYGKGRIFNKLNRITKNKMIKACISKKKKMVTMNLIRCDSHNEVLKTLLGRDYNKY